MPNRSPEQRKKIDSMVKISPDSKCNARTPNGYCKMPAGFKTDHVGNGRCYLHGGSAGRPIVQGVYSNKFTSTVKDEYDKISNDPMLIDLYSEFALMKTSLSSFIESIQGRLNEIGTWVDISPNGVRNVSPEARILMNLIESMSRIFSRITDAELKSNNTLTINQVHGIINQIKYSLNVTCGECPVRTVLADKLKNTRSPNVT